MYMSFCLFILQQASLIGRVLKVRVFVAQLRERRNALAELDTEQSTVDRKLKAHRKRLTKSNKSIQMLYSSMLVKTHHVWTLA